MILPREFIALYGLPRNKVVTLAAGETYLVQPDRDRYLLWFFGSTQSFQVFPTIDLGGLTPAVIPANTPDSTLKITHAIDGAAVNLGYTVTSPLGANTIIILEGFMRPARVRGATRAKTIR